MTTWESITWDVARAGGITAYLLLGLAVAVGLSLSLHWQSPRWPRIINSELHNFVTLLASIFIVLHVLAVWLDPFTHFGVAEILMPLASHYRPLWMALGIVGLYLLVSIGISTWLRPRLGYTLWRRLHFLTLVLFAAVTVHGLATGSDSSTWWATAMYLSSSLAVAALLVLKLRRAYVASHASKVPGRLAARAEGVPVKASGRGIVARDG
jgi:predicted ferric reductase